MKYNELIRGINAGIIRKVSFSITNYAHYRNCIVEVKCSNAMCPESGRIIWFHLTPDGYEKKGFLNKINEDVKLFELKGKGKFTLKQIWDKVVVHSIEYESETGDGSLS